MLRKGSSETEESERHARVCSLCDSTFVSEKQFLDHLGIHGLNLSCDRLRNNEQNEGEMETAVACVVRPFKCCLCELVFDRFSQLNNHRRSVHSQERSKLCQICGKGFFRQTDLKTHLNIHLGTNRCMCEVCGRKFNHVSNLIRHSRTHSGVKPYPCTVCGKRFAQINTLARHVTIHKRADQDVECFFCDKRYKSENGVREHMRKLHGFREKTSSRDGGRVVKRKHYCKICGESFQFVELLRFHDKTHENVKMLDCKSCNQRFLKTDDIKEHRCGRLKLLGADERSSNKDATGEEESAGLIQGEIAPSNLCGDENDPIQLAQINEDSEQIYNAQTESSRLNGIRNFHDRYLDYKLSQTTKKLQDDKQTKETIVYVTTEQLANMNTEQVVDTANHFLHEHLMELAAENSLQSDNVNGRDCDEETVVSEMINSCWKDIEIPDVNESEISEKRAVLSSRNNAQSIIYVQALEKDGLIFLNETGNLIENSEKDLKRNSSGLMENENLCKKGTEVKLGSDKLGDDYLPENHKQERNTRGIIKGLKSHYFNEKNGNDNSLIQTTIHSLAHNMFDEELLKNSSGKSSESQEPTLSLVQTENGDEFYELLITNSSESKAESSFEFDRIQGATLGERAAQNEPVPESLLKLVQLENGQRIIELMRNTLPDESEITRRNAKCETVDEIEEATPSVAFIEKSVLSMSENVIEQDEMRVKNFSHNKSEKIFYLAQNSKDNLIDFFEIETLGTQEQTSFNLASDEAMRNAAQTNFDNLQTLGKSKISPNDEAPLDGESCDLELLGLMQSNLARQICDKGKIEHEKIAREDGPMVRLVQNEDGAQFFELIRGDLEFDESQDSGLVNESKELDQSQNSKLTINPKGSKYGVVNDGNKFEPDSNRKKRTKINGKIYNCDVCKKSFSKGYNYRQHIGTHFADQQKFKCKECGTFFAWKSTLNKHMATHRAGGQQKFVCEICPKEHVKRDHLKERNHKCGHCAKKFFKKFDLKIHIRTHTKERPYECRVCYKSFHHQSHIIRHERIHSGERPYACNICEKTFTQLGSLKNHRQRHKELKIDILDYQMDEDDPLPRTGF